MARQTKDERLSLRISSDLKRRVEKWAAHSNMSLSAAVTVFLENLLEKHEQKSANKARGSGT